MTDILMQYGLFLAKTITVLVVVWLVISMLVSLSHRKGRTADRLEVKSLNQRYDMIRAIMQKAVLPKKEFKKFRKEAKARRKADEAARARGARRKRVFVLDFHGDIKATAVASLRQEITAVLSMATPEDEVLVRLENAGGFVHEHGLAASQLIRLREKQIPLTVAVDKVAASGGYMMACAGDRILAAPFAIVGSIGVLAQLPNFHRLLERQGIDFEQFKAGELKRTVSIFGKNTEEDRQRFRKQIEDTHELFKDLVARNRPRLDVGRVATGEYWYGTRALELQLVDGLTTSDDYLMESGREADLFEVSFTARMPVSERIASVIQSAADRLMLAWWQRARDARMLTES